MVSRPIIFRMPAWNRDKPSIQYRTLKPEELPQIAAIFSKSFKFKVTGEEYAKRFKNRQKGKSMFESQFVAVHGGKVIAGIRADSKPLYIIHPRTGERTLHECGEINDVCTHPKYRRLGIARRLLENAVQYMRDQGWKIAALQADPKYHAHQLYQSEGFYLHRATGDLWHVGLGRMNVRWNYYNVLGLILPLAKSIAPWIAPHPPRGCIDLLEDYSAIENRGNPVDLAICHVSSASAMDDPWVERWRSGIQKASKSVQAIPFEIMEAALLNKEMNKPVSRKIMIHYGNNPRFKAFLNAGGMQRNFMLGFKGNGCKSNGVHLYNSGTSHPGKLVGGLRYSLKFMKRGKLKVFLPFIDMIWVDPGYWNEGIGTCLLERFRDFMGLFFPFFVCRASTGNLPLRKALLKSNYFPIGGGITQVKRLHDGEVYKTLSDWKGAWYLT